jgi:hypothetical protein
LNAQRPLNEEWSNVYLTLYIVRRN